MEHQKTVVGETLTFSHVKDPEGNPMQILVTGVFTMADETDPFWYHGVSYYDEVLLISEEDFSACVVWNDEYTKSITTDEILLFDYQDLNVGKARALLEAATKCTEKITALKKMSMSVPLPISGRC